MLFGCVWSRLPGRGPPVKILAFMSQAKPSSPVLLREKGRIMSASEIERTLVRLAHEIIEKNNGSQNLGLVGIKRRGVPLAEGLAALIGSIEKRAIQTGVLGVNA